MIKTLTINNYALIQGLEMLPSPKLNIITGETGAGKSIMLGAVGLLLGNRADTKALFSDADKCVVEGIFDIKNYQLKDFFDENELDYDQECIVRREISATGKSRGFINDTPVTLDIMKNLGEYLMDIHSQHESLHLGNNQYQRDILDLYAGNESILSEYKSVYQKYQKEKTAYESLTLKAQKNQSNQEYQQYLFNELEAAHLSSGEQELLEQELEVLENAEEIKLNLTQISLALDQADFSIINQLKETLTLLGPIRKYSKKLDGYFERINSANLELKDLAEDISREQDTVEFDPERIQIVKDRIDLLFRLQQKHQVKTVGDLIAIRDRVGAELETLLNLDDTLAKAKKGVDLLEKEVLKLGEVLSIARTTQSLTFAKAVENIIHKLGIENGKVDFQVSRTLANASGLDKVEMLFSANKGVSPKELKNVASGGEFSRIIFAIKYLIADKTALPTIIFDEIDTGVSGEVALQMVAMMKEMSKNHQVIAISHLPQFAAGGDAHYFVYKDHSADRSISKIRQLEESERVTEIAKMIGGNNPGDHAFQSARELLNTAG
ncbi:MAG: DNA repair protein RecN (Recombination protein N) [Cyclobacteriaceae bacterium]|jgi:DNA repair protein RecN (Recombination protein N)